MPDQQQTLSTALRQEQQLSARQLQSLELLHLPALELEERLIQELAQNPLLEAEIDDFAPPPEAPETAPEPDDEASLAEKAAESDEWADELPLPGGSAQAFGATEEERDFLLNSLAAPPSLQEQLSAELATTDAPPRLRQLAEEVIAAIDDSGYLRSTAADLAMSAAAESEEVEEAIRLVQSFDPPGVGCRDLAECLRLQLERAGRLSPLLENLLGEHLEEIARNRLPQLARTLSVSLDELNAALGELKRLNPFPGSALAPEHADFVVPEVAIRRTLEGYEAVPRRERQVRLYLAERYLKLLETPDLPPEDRAYLKEKLQQARELIRALEQRESTILRIAQVIIETQRDFLDAGVEALKPLTMKQAGERLELHETTISRAVANKFVETPQGVFPFKFFFTTGFTNEDGEALSNRAVMERLRELVRQENPARPLSDEQLAVTLKAEGLAIARRTVAKYRESMNIPSSNLRKRHE